MMPWPRVVVAAAPSSCFYHCNPQWQPRLGGALGLFALQVEVECSWADPTLSYSDGNGRAGLMFP